MPQTFEFRDYPDFLGFAPPASAPAARAPGGDPIAPLRTAPYPYIAPGPPGAALAGRTALVTGASQGIGRLVALELARAGCSGVALVARSAERLAAVADEVRAAAAAASSSPSSSSSSPSPCQVLALEADVTSDSEVRAAAAAVSEAFGGRLDVLVNNAGLLEAQPVALGESDPLEWWRVWEVNVRGVYLCTRHLLPLLLAAAPDPSSSSSPSSSSFPGPPLRTVVNVTSGMGFLMAPGHSAYTASKQAMLRLTENLAGGYGGGGGGGGDGLVAVALEPGVVATAMAAQMNEEMRATPHDDPGLAAQTLVWLVRERREWLSGRVVSARWCMERLAERREEIVAGDLLKLKVTLA